jgi:ubiquinone/menaquinone biosynthesis C-methylase UbiE
MIAEKASVKAFWDQAPCGTRDVAFAPGSQEFFEAIERHRYQLEPCIQHYARFQEWRQRRVLEVGCGVGTDLLQFARAGADVYGVDLSSRSVELAQRRFELYGMAGDIREADAEALPFRNATFDLVYSWGVIHHAPHPAQVVREISRILKPGGRICVMIYHKYSLLAMQAYLACGLFRFRPFQSLDRIIAHHVESPGTRVYSRQQARELFQDFDAVRIETILTRHDLRYGRRRYLPAWLMKVVPDALGWFMVIQGRKPLVESL